MCRHSEYKLNKDNIGVYWRNVLYLSHLVNMWPDPKETLAWGSKVRLVHTLDSVARIRNHSRPYTAVLKENETTPPHPWVVKRGHSSYSSTVIVGDSEDRDERRKEHTPPPVSDRLFTPRWFFQEYCPYLQRRGCGEVRCFCTDLNLRWVVQTCPQVRGSDWHTSEVNTELYVTESTEVVSLEVLKCVRSCFFSSVLH